MARRKTAAKSSFLATKMTAGFGRSSSRSRKKTPAPAMSEATRARLREILALALMGATVFTALACLTAYSGGNWCGSTGEQLARSLLGTFGYATYLLLFCMAQWAVILFFQLESEAGTIRGSGLILCLVSLSALISHVSGDDLGAPFPPGGAVGDYITHQLQGAGGLGHVGTRIVLVVLSLITFVLATDIHVYTALLTGAQWVRDKGVQAREALDVAREEAQAARAVAEKDLVKKERASAKRIRELEKEQRKLEREAKKAAKAEAKAIKAAEKAQTKLAKLEAAQAAAKAATATGKAKAATEDAAAKAAEKDALSEKELEAFAVLEDVEGASIPESMVDGAEVADFDEGEIWEADDAAVAVDDEPEAVEEPELADDEEWVEDESEWSAEAGDEAAPEEEYEEEEEGEWGDPEADEEGAEFAAADEEVWEDEEPVDGDDVVDDEALAVAAEGPRVKTLDEADPGIDLNPDGEVVDVTESEPGEYVLPAMDLLDDQEVVDQGDLDDVLSEKTELLEQTLQSFKIEAKVVAIQKGPVISMFELSLAPGIKVDKIRALEDDLAIALRARTVRIVAPLPDKNTIGMELPNPIRENVRMKALLDCKEFTDSSFALPIFLGKDAAGRPMIVDLAKMPHLLVAGATGSGKSVCLNAIIASFLYTRTPEQVKLVLIDPKMVELSQFENAPHLACPVISDMKRAPAILEWAVAKMEERYKLLSRAGVRNIYSYNKLGRDGLRERFGDVVDEDDFPHFLPFVVIIVDELADLMMTAAKDVETSITRLAAKSRAVGIHIILATQRPSTNVITGLIKANLPTRVAFMVSSKIDSRVILDVNGAEQLLGQGDMLFLPPHSSNVVRGQCTFLSEEEVRRIMDSVKTDSGPQYERELVQRRSEGSKDPSEVDELYDAATRFMIDTQRGSASLLQRKFAIGYTRASRLIDLMADEGVLGEYKGSQAREVLMTLEEWVALNPEARESPQDGEQV